MQGWLNPSGDQDARTYWVRRALVIATVVAVIALAVWGLSRPRGTTAVPQESPSDSPASSTAASSGTPIADPTDSEPPVSPVERELESPTQAAEPPAQPTAEPPTDDQDASGEPTTEETGDTEATIGPCPANSLDLTLTGPNPVTAGEPVVFDMTIASHQQRCIADLAALSSTLLVTSGNDRIWSSDDCPAWQLAASSELEAGQPADHRIGWPAARSNGCELVGVLGAGTYVATLTSGDASVRFVFQVAN